MSAKEVKFSTDARAKMPARRRYSRRCGERSRSAPRGATSLIEKSFGAPRITKDGVTVAKEIELFRQVREHGRPDGARGCLQDQ